MTIYDQLSHIGHEEFAAALRDVSTNRDFGKFVEKLKPHAADILLPDYMRRCADWLERSLEPGSGLPPPPDAPTWQWVARLLYGAIYEVD